MRRRAYLALALALWACGRSGPPPEESASAPGSAPAAPSESSAPATPAPAEASAPSAAVANRVEPLNTPASVAVDRAQSAVNTGPILSEPERRRRFEERPVVPAPRLLPPRIATLGRIAGARLTGATHAVYGAPDSTPSAEDAKLELRLYGQTPAVEAALRTALVEAQLLAADAPLPTGSVELQGARWRLHISLFRAPEGEPREHRVDFSWRRDALDVTLTSDCDRPRAVEPPPELPAWLRPLLEQTSTRRVVGSRAVNEAEGRRADVVLMFHNGELHDNHLGRIVEAAQKAGYRLTAGEGTNVQAWKRGRETLNVQPARRGDVPLGCKALAPLLELVLRTTIDEVKP